MSNIYIQEPPTTGKVVMKTTVGDIDLELWTKEAPKACRNFIQLCMESYYNDTIFHRILKGFIAQGGDPTGTGEGGESIYGHPFKDEFHTRLRFCRRGLLAMANAGKDDNGSQFFFTLGATPELQNKHTIFGKVTGETIYNMLKLEDALVDENDRPQYPQKILKTEVLNNPFQDIVSRVVSEKKEDSKEKKKNKKTGVKNFKLLSFGEEAEEDEEESSILNRQYSSKGKSAHDCLSDPKLSSQSVIEPAEPPSKKIKEDRSSDWESDDDETRTPEELAALQQEKEAMKERIKNKLKDSKKISQSKPKIENDETKDENINENAEIEEYYFGKYRDEERKKKAEAIRKEIRDLKRSVQNEKKAKEIEQKQQAEKEGNKSEIMKEYIETQEKYKKAKEQLPRKGKAREDFTMKLFKQFKNKLQNAKEHTKDDMTSSDKKTSKDTEDDNPHNESWLTHALQCEEKAPVLAKDASTKDDDWFEIYDPRNPLNKRRRGEKSHKSQNNKSSKKDGIRPRDWQPRKSSYKVPFRVMRLCLLGMLLPLAFIVGPLYLRYRVYSEQLYALAISDQRLIDSKISTVWCQSQMIKVNATFNAYLMSNEPVVEKEAIPISMTRHLIMEDDMKEYWGFYLLHGSSVTVSTCVRWPGASLTIIRGFKNLHECAFIGDDSSEELEELVEIAKEEGFLDVKSTTETVRLSNVPDKMRRADQDVHFHEDKILRLNISKSSTHQSSHELDPETMRNILTQLLAKTEYTKKKQKKNLHHHYEAVFRDIINMDKPVTNGTTHPRNLQDQLQEESISRFDNNKKISENSTKFTPMPSKIPVSFQEEQYNYNESERRNFQQNSTFSLNSRPNSTISNKQMESSMAQEIVKNQEESKTKQTNSEEVFQDVLRKINSFGNRGKQILHKLMDTIDMQAGAKGAALKQLVNDTMNDKKLSREAKRRRRRDLVLSSPLYQELTEEDEDGDAAIEEDMLHPDGIAEDRGTVNETTLNDRSNSEFWSSFSSSEERLLECKGLILNLPLTPHRFCTPKHESDHSTASFANTVTYRVPLNGYYFFVFNSENEIQPNYVRVKFDLLKTVYNTSNPVHACKNSTKECSLPFKIFSNERTILELPLSGNDSQWNDEYIGVSVCEPRTMVYTICVIMVPLLILCFAFH
ncbi:PREDICTED: uncharacterized protein LOC108694515 [Atta colombica]|uniref:uncharacterized protein LOC108694515 n=1 Tax=Atta colombica TaxID=520822 RepID=UPI00084CCD25|nr:PREDICTED: uncharacterized protein LOC108694515 [Atta colombica]